MNGDVFIFDANKALHNLEKWLDLLKSNTRIKNFKNSLEVIRKTAQLVNAVASPLIGAFSTLDSSLIKLNQRIELRYYSGFLGTIRKILSYVGLYRFTNTQHALEIKALRASIPQSQKKTTEGQVQWVKDNSEKSVVDGFQHQRANKELDGSKNEKAELMKFVEAYKLDSPQLALEEKVVAFYTTLKANLEKEKIPYSPVYENFLGNPSNRGALLAAHLINIQKMYTLNGEKGVSPEFILAYVAEEAASH